VFETAVGKVGVYICYDRHFPEGARALGLNGAEIVLHPERHVARSVEYLWRIEQVSHAVANGYYVGHDQPGRHRAGPRRRRLLRPELLLRTRVASSSASSAPPTTRS
jgi:predicted amidohydrolase